MLSLGEMIQIVRSTVHDTQKLEYTDKDIINTINSGIRFIRRQIRTIRPQLLIEPSITGTLGPEVGFIELPFVPTKIVDVYIDRERAEAVNFLTIENPLRQGSPVTKYYLTGTKTMNFYPVPNHNVSYSIRAVGSASKLINLEDQSPFADDFDDFIIEYACIRLSFTNEFNMSQETQLLSVLIDQVQNNILSIEEPETIVSGYYNTSVGGYW